MKSLIWLPLLSLFLIGCNSAPEPSAEEILTEMEELTETQENEVEVPLEVLEYTDVTEPIDTPKSDTESPDSPQDENTATVDADLEALIELETAYDEALLELETLDF